jgi:multiple sugar transport system substrate-binding protein
MRSPRSRIAALAAAVGLAAVACGNGAQSATPDDGGDTTTSEASETSGGDDGEVAELTFLAGFTGGDRPAYEALVEMFNESHPDIKVTLDIQPWDSIGQTLPAALATGSGPDLATPSFQEGSIFEYAEGGTIMPLDDLYGEGEGKVDKDAMPPAIFDAFALDGTMYAAPANFATLMLYYNEDLLADAGLDGPPQTMEEFRSAAATVTGQSDAYGVALAESQTIPMWPILIWADGGQIIGDDGCSALDDPATIEAVKRWADLIVSAGISPVGETGAGTDNLFSAEQAALQMNGPWAAAGYEEAGVNFGLAEIPEGEAGQVTLASAVPIVVNANTPHKDAAYEFLSWWTGQEAQRYLALNSGFPPARTDLADDPELAENERVAKFAQAVPYAQIFLSGVVPFAEAAGDVFEPAIGRLTRGEPVEAVMTGAAQQMDSILGCG